MSLGAGALARVPMLPLDSLATRPCVVKLDVEGMEFAALSGASRIVAEADIVFFEALPNLARFSAPSPKALFGLLPDFILYGYSPYFTADGTRNIGRSSGLAVDLHRIDQLCAVESWEEFEDVCRMKTREGRLEMIDNFIAARVPLDIDSAFPWIEISIV